MLDNKLYDALVIGASKEGVEAVKYLAENGKNVGLISRALPRIPTSIGAEENEVKFLAYRKGLIIVYLKDKQLVCRNLIIATGKKPIVGGTKNVVYDASELPGGETLVIISKNDIYATNTAFEVSKKYKKILIVTESADITCETDVLKERLTHSRKIKVLPLCSPIDVAKTSGDANYLVTLDTFDTIACSDVFGAIGQTPDVFDFETPLYETCEDGAIKTIKYATKTPGVFAIGGVADYKTFSPEGLNLI